MCDNVPGHIESSAKYNIKQVECGGSYTIYVDIDNNLIVFEKNNYGPLNGKIEINLYFRRNNIKIRSISCGFSHTWIVDNYGNGYIFGKNDCGRTGNGQYGDGLCVDTPWYKLLMIGIYHTFGAGDCRQIGNGECNHDCCVDATHFSLQVVI